MWCDGGGATSWAPFSLSFFFFLSLLLLLGVPVTAGLREQGGREAARAARIDGSDEAAASSSD